VRGIVIGNRSVAVFEDENGNQRLIPEGGSVDGQTRVKRIERGRVTVETQGKEKTLTIEEEARND
jgi:type II secretory pathway component PulC